MKTQSNIRTTANNIAPYVLMPGDPARVDVIARYLKDARLVSNYREFRAITGTYKNIPVSVVSTGIGCPSTAMAAEELINLGAKALIRVGTCGGAWRADIPAGSLIIPIACVRDEGTTKEYIQPEFPAVADIEVINALCKSAQQQKAKFFVGINRTHDAFYGADFSIKKWGVYMQDDRLRQYISPILSSEMETSALFVIASLRGVQAGAVLAVNANPEPLSDRMRGKSVRVISEASRVASRRVVAHAIEVALEAVVLIARSQKKEST